MFLVVTFLSACFSKACNVLDTDPAQFTPDANDAGLLYCNALWIIFKEASYPSSNAFPYNSVFEGFIYLPWYFLYLVSVNSNVTAAKVTRMPMATPAKRVRSVAAL